MKNLWAAVSTDTVLHYGTLAMILLVGAVLRFNNLGFKALWLDEVITALFSSGRSYLDVPLDQFFSVQQLEALFAFQPGVSDVQIIERIATQSTHPPLFFLMMYRWMSWLQPSLDQLAWTLRSLPALFGIANIAALYVLNRIAFSPIAGLMAAACMAVSPFAVYLSQEARHYSLPALLITLALVGLVQIQQDLQRQRFRPWVWLGWVALCSFGLYVHYFFILALLAQIGALMSWMVWQRRQVVGRGWVALGMAIAGLALITLPWLPVLLGHSDRPETDWLEIRNNLGGYLAPIYQSLIGWVLMVMILPVEAQPLLVAVPSGIIMLVCTGLIVRQSWRGIHRYWQHFPHRAPLYLIAVFTLGILLEFGVIVYGLKKDLTVAPRYNFVYYPGVCALLGAALAGLVERSGSVLPPMKLFRTPALVLLIGIFSSLLVTHNLAFIKTYDPQAASRLLYQEPAKPMLLVVAYNSLQDIALGLSNAIALRQVAHTEAVPTLPQFAFLSPSPTVNAPMQWEKLKTLKAPTAAGVSLWLAALPGALPEWFPESTTLTTADGQSSQCPADLQRPARIGFFYRLYRCGMG